MAEKKYIEVLLDGKPLKMSGDESEEYMLRVVNYLNGKLEEFRRVDAYRRAGKEDQHRLLELNIADDYYKAKLKCEELEVDLVKRENELYDMKHDSVNKDLQLDSLREKLQKAEEKVAEQEKTIVQLQTELKERRR